MDANMGKMHIIKTNPMLNLQFKSKKTTQVICRLLSKNNGSMNYMKLIKELYLIDRICLDRFNRVLTGDTYFSMQHGPVLSTVLDKINSSQLTEDSYWDKYIKRKGPYKIALIETKCSNSELSPREVAIIDEVCEKFRKIDKWDIVTWCHDNLKEWKKPTLGRDQIFIADILKALGKTNSEITEIEEEINSAEFAKKAFSDE